VAVDAFAHRRHRHRFGNVLFVVIIYVCIFSMNVAMSRRLIEINNSAGNNATVAASMHSYRQKITNHSFWFR
jgi:hypothetical protein